MKKELQTDRRFMNLTIPFNEKQMEKLEASLLHRGCIEPIFVWNDVILDGHKRYKLCSYEEIEYEIKNMSFETVDEAVLWVSWKRILQAEKKTVIYRYLSGKIHKCNKKVNLQRQENRECHDPAKSSDINGEEYTAYTEKQIAEELGWTMSTMDFLGQYATALDIIAEKDQLFFDALIKEDISMRQRNVMKLSKLEPKKVVDIRKKMISQRNQEMRKKNKNDVRMPDKEVKKEELPIFAGIKEMPVFDPDMELKGLTLTIPTWINVMSKTEKKMDANAASEKAKENLIKNLMHLQGQIDSMLSVLSSSDSSKVMGIIKADDAAERHETENTLPTIPAGITEAEERGKIKASLMAETVNAERRINTSGMASTTFKVNKEETDEGTDEREVWK